MEAREFRRRYWDEDDEAPFSEFELEAWTRGNFSEDCAASATEAGVVRLRPGRGG